MLEDPNDEPQYGERIPYVIARGEPGSRLVDRAIAPHELFRDRCLSPASRREFELIIATQS